jgi:DNA uptake protein ComE-like DNA-binding protein
VGFDQLDQTGQATRITAATGDLLVSGVNTDQLSAAILTGLQSLPVEVAMVSDCSSETDGAITTTFKVGIWSAGANNQFGHPHPLVVDLLHSLGVEVYGTATHGTVVVVTDGNTYEVRTQHAATAPPAQPAQPSQPAQADPPPPSPGGSCQPGQVDINSASFEELQEIHQIGPARAQDIINMRPFASVDALTRISGIGDGILGQIKAQGLACAS